MLNRLHKKLMSDTAIIVPARLDSQRFPRKLLHPVNGDPLILCTARRIRSEVPEMPLYFAVADKELEDVLKKEGYEVVLTDSKLTSGTDRIAAANEQIGAARVINVQADEPLITKSQINTLSDLLQNAPMATLARPFTDANEFEDPNCVKVVINLNGLALYFSRATIPFARDHSSRMDAIWFRKHPSYFHHLGVYAYDGAFLKMFADLPEGKLEQIEKLEQLRALENGYSISVGITEDTSIGVDVPEDIKCLENFLQSSS